LIVTVIAPAVRWILPARSHRKPDLVLRRIYLRLNHQRQIAFAERRQRKMDAHASLIVAGAGMAAAIERSFDQGSHCGADLWLPVRFTRNFQLERDFPRRKPRSRIQ